MFSQKQLRNVYSLGALLVCTLIALSLAESDGESSVKGHGFGDSYNWVTLDEGTKISKEEKKPLMLIIHKSWCGACKSLKPKFAKAKVIQDLSKHFVMVNTEDDDEPKGDIYTPDGGYIPRILFFDSEGSLLKNIINEQGNPDYKYYYHDPSSIAESMKKVLSTLSIEYEGSSGTPDKEASEEKNESSHSEL